METCFAENIKQAFAESCYAMAMKNREVSEEYQSASEEYKKLFDSIRDKLGEDRKLMLRLEELQNRMGSMDDECIYLQGFIDCVYLLKRIRLL
ncbi:MAG: hypothetical protein BGN88_09045 [Clostridiales bacterium 43-6]|nr:MAG: hypothetical protein BGN88_09045 [Clostridiales bacterium 43-6]